ncbi:hypothetical protein GCM10022381_23690 [Leifsonia kafniensis]|uniref:DUF4440 domain-containing protein n=1 Tax=Leifsonia kafniensis TaxID=475957 RepID=A0ABP7KLP7_9MICO
MSEVTQADAQLTALVLDLENRRHQALIAVDLAALDAMFDEDLVHIHAPGLTHNKTQLLEHVDKRRPYLETRRGELTIRVIGDVLIVTGPLTNRLRSPEGGERTIGGVVTQVLRRDNAGTWRFLSFQMTPTGEHVWPTLPGEQWTSAEPIAGTPAPNEK